MRKIFLSIAFIFILSASVFTAGFEPGVNVRTIEKDGVEITWVLVNYENASEITCMDKSGS
ncbi:MAG: hypothetical protein HPY65_06330 [Syntrophaceae bacterium]|nr:hypothetical protein [Syntrophaceae bacterium]